MGLIPARGGSEGIPRKNLAKVGGVTLLDRAILAALECDLISSVVVSSDDEDILRAAEESGAAPLKRSQESSTGSARAEAVVRHFMDEPGGSSLSPSDILVYLQPTSPFRTSSHITKALEAMFAAQTASLVSVKEATEYPAKFVTTDSDGLIQPAPYGADASANRQQLPRSLYPNGAIYAFTVESFQREQSIPIFGALPFLMSARDSLDIDSPDDLTIAQAVAKYVHD